METNKKNIFGPPAVFVVLFVVLCVVIYSLKKSPDVSYEDILVSRVQKTYVFFYDPNGETINFFAIEQTNGPLDANSLPIIIELAKQMKKVPEKKTFRFLESRVTF